MVQVDKRAAKLIHVDLSKTHLQFTFPTKTGESTISMQVDPSKDKYFAQLIDRVRVYNTAREALENEQKKGFKANPFVIVWQYGKEVSAKNSLPIGMRP